MNSITNIKNGDLLHLKGKYISQSSKKMFISYIWHSGSTRLKFN